MQAQAPTLLQQERLRRCYLPFAVVIPRSKLPRIIILSSFEDCEVPSSNARSILQKADNSNNVLKLSDIFS